ncbi:hypothetical protein ACS5PU_00135 [Pedobacter sp. GSP4]|uniref:hypothetical protein n=1 Tax=Pedobacter sp. GSP4 TaxID=3453716 RepID=UPI003EEBACEE
MEDGRWENGSKWFVRTRTMASEITITITIANSCGLLSAIISGMKRLSNRIGRRAMKRSGRGIIKVKGRDGRWESGR